MGDGNGKSQTGFVEILTMDERFQTLGTETDSCLDMDSFGGATARVLARENLVGNCKCRWNTN